MPSKPLLQQGVGKATELLRSGAVSSTSRDASMLLLACAHCKYYDAAVQELADAVLAACQIRHWDTQAVTNALYAWAQLSQIRGAGAFLRPLGVALIDVASERPAAEYAPEARSQLQLAQAAAEGQGLLGLPEQLVQ
jgi:hypothetical protein